MLDKIYAEIPRNFTKYTNQENYQDNDNYLKIIKYLVENGVDINAKNKYDKTVLMKASGGGHTKIVGNSIINTSSVGNTELHELIKQQRKNCQIFTF